MWSRHSQLSGLMFHHLLPHSLPPRHLDALTWYMCCWSKHRFTHLESQKLFPVSYVCYILQTLYNLWEVFPEPSVRQPLHLYCSRCTCHFYTHTNLYISTLICVFQTVHSATSTTSGIMTDHNSYLFKNWKMEWMDTAQRQNGTKLRTLGSESVMGSNSDS